jgi:hypothetical protein
MRLLSRSNLELGSFRQNKPFAIGLAAFALSELGSFWQKLL